MIDIREQIVNSSKSFECKSPRLHKIAKFINTVNTLHQRYEAKIVEGYCNTDRKIGRLRWPGKGRYGNRLIVTIKSDKSVVIDHNSAETYRQNCEVCDKVVKLEGF